MTNTTTRVLVAVVTIPFILAAGYFGGYVWFLFIAALLCLALGEWYSLAGAKGVFPQRAGGTALSILLLLVFIHDRLRQTVLSSLFPGGFHYPQQWQALLILLLCGFVCMLAIELFRKKGSALLNLGTTIFGVLYLGLFLGTTVGLREIFSPAEFPVGRFFGTVTLSTGQLAQLDRWGGFTMCAILTTIWICDTAAYFGGRALGRHPLFPRVSPKKTWEGAWFGFIFSILWMIGMKYLFLDYLDIFHAVVMGFLIGTVGQIGDLVESLLKRDAQIKDSSSVIPGHGGIIDRFDSLIFVSPVLFLYLDFIVFM